MYTKNDKKSYHRIWYLKNKKKVIARARLYYLNNKNRPKKGGIYKNCEKCNNSFRTVLSVLKLGKGRHCSKSCRYSDKLKSIKSKRIRNTVNWPQSRKERDMTPMQIEKKRYWARCYRSRKKGSAGSHTFEEWLLLKAFYEYMCLCCKRQEPEIKLTEDHIVPLSRGGSDNIDNIQPLCQRCNTSKSAKTINYMLLKGGETQNSDNNVRFF